MTKEEKATLVKGSENKESEVFENPSEKEVEEKQENENYVAFKKPFLFGGETYEGIELDLEKLTGNDVEEAEVQFVAKNAAIAAQTPLKEMSKGFQAILAAKAAGVVPEMISALPAADYAKVTTKVQVFLLTQD